LSDISKQLFSLPRIATFLAALLILSIVPENSRAVEVPSLYSAEVAFDADARNARESAYEDALAAVLARVSGESLSSDRAAIEQLFPNPAAFVMQFRQEAEDVMWVSFDGDAIESILRNAGQSVWGSDRPLTLVWLAVDWGQGSREIIGADEQELSRSNARSIDRNRMLRERILEIADRRGLPLAFPLLDTTDLQSVTFSDIWGGFDDRIVAASGRYDANSILIGRVRAASSQQNRWTYAFGNERRNWTGAAETVIAQIADLLATELAVGGNAPLRTLDVSIGGIESVDAYGSVQKILRSAAVVENYHVVEVAGDTVHYAIEVRGDAERLRRALEFAGLIEQNGGALTTGFGTVPSLQFYFDP